MKACSLVFALRSVVSGRTVHGEGGAWGGDRFGAPGAELEEPGICFACPPRRLEEPLWAAESAWSPTASFRSLICSDASRGLWHSASSTVPPFPL